MVVGFRYGSQLDPESARAAEAGLLARPLGLAFSLGRQSLRRYLIYNLKGHAAVPALPVRGRQRIYVVAGLGINYQRSGSVTLAPVTASACTQASNAQYQVYTDRRDWFPL